MPLFLENVVHFGFFTNKIVIVLNATGIVIFQYKNASKMSFKKYYTIGLFQLLQRQI